ncbi:helix-turn-helix transcriptional regulator [Phyllobacterium meliloti]|nr:transcriptional regulator [Phyllobacterium sp. T1293]UGX88010.1 transcriptional regulator [Phyllobacterium sp. T1293]
MSRQAIDVYRKRGEFVQPVSLPGRRFAFVRAEVIAWINERVASRVAA